MQARSPEFDDAARGGGSGFTDPVDDDAYPRITAPADGEPCSSDLFPDDWGSSGPTERDQAVIDAGSS